VANDKALASSVEMFISCVIASKLEILSSFYEITRLDDFIVK
jgi:hypothetical protein